jgi:hypothetical protein
MLRGLALVPLLLLPSAKAQTIAFSDYPAIPSHVGRPAMPRLVTPEQKRFRHVLQRAITKGYNVVEGGTEHERRGPNFAGVFVLVQWGCGSDCMQAAIIDTRDGTVLAPPVLPGETPGPGFLLPTGSADMRTLQFNTSSRLLGIPSRKDGLTCYFALKGHSWQLLTKQMTPDVR